MLLIRLQRTGRENTPTFRITVSEKARSAKKGAHEILGHYLPALKKPVFEVQKERVVYWISKGAKPSNTLARLLKNAGMPDMEKFMKRYAKQKSKKEVVEAPATTAPAAPAAEGPKKEPARDASREEKKEETKTEAKAEAAPEKKKEEKSADAKA